MSEQKYRVLSGSALKCLAMISMIIDHTALNLLARSSITVFRFGIHVLTLHKLMRDFGRLAFPLFAFLLTQGFRHTRSKKRYGFNLLSFAILSEIPWNLEHTGTLFYPKQNVFFTLFLGFAGLCALEYFKSDTKKQILSLFALYLVALNLHSDYGIIGFGFIIMLHVMRQQPVVQALLGCCFLNSTWIGGLAFIPINMYNEKRGFIRSPILKYAFYSVYPVHLLILYYLKAKYVGF